MRTSLYKSNWKDRAVSFQGVQKLVWMAIRFRTEVNQTKRTGLVRFVISVRIRTDLVKNWIASNQLN